MQSLRELKNYLRRLSRRWVLWLFVLGDAVGVIASAVSPNIKLPLPTYWGLALIGLLWASFQVYNELLSQLPKNVPPQPDLNIELIEGHEYTYTVRSDRTNLQENTPMATIIVHGRISNIGSAGLDVLSIKSAFESPGGPWILNDGDPRTIDGTNLSTPVHLNPGATVLCDLHSDIRPDPLNSARFAARIALINANPPSVPVTISVEAVDSTGRISDFWRGFTVATRPMKDLYIKLWEETDRKELLRLARVPDPGITIQKREQIEGANQET